ncbi:periplasmic binding protein-like I [Rhizoclosmatium globosum]|uniref:Periplasmic binding protein-like I n=1 Tax=Rhizoclosmatium globosum TaxID=329046 RepID=A0A1Y2C584_9FUNG|nr:periplasmic binding protein-like I [Rhizoclosmatium globosum]|eukprot:ORY42034.1 periplasmic binding protein-like I [Rhizoclosmatium globosum]
MVTSIALGLIGNYCTIPGVSVNGALVSNMTSVYDPGQIDYYGNSGPAFFTDVMSVFAVEYAQSIGILPGVKIKLRRFTDCGQYEPLLDQSYSGSPSGFALSILAQDIVETYPDVIGVIGTEYSSTAKGVAEVLSNNKITYCSTASGAPSLSDKKKYPYFWRVVPSAGTGEHFYQLLSSFNVTRVAVVYQSNSELGRGFASDFLQSMMAHGITVIAYMPVSLEASQEMIEYVGKSLDASSVKYIFLSGSGSFLGKILDGLGRANFFSQDKVWLVANLVSTPSPDTVLVANKTGIILMYPKGFPNTSLQKTVMSQFLEKYPAATDPEFVYLYQTFDCVMLMLLGLQNLVRSNSSFTIDMLAKRQLQEHINFTLFQNLGYSGLVNSPVELTDNGDLASPWAAYYYTGDYLNITGTIFWENCWTHLYQRSVKRITTLLYSRIVMILNQFFMEDLLLLHRMEDKLCQISYNIQCRIDMELY